MVQQSEISPKRRGKPGKDLEYFFQSQTVYTRFIIKYKTEDKMEKSDKNKREKSSDDHQRDRTREKGKAKGKTGRPSKKNKQSPEKQINDGDDFQRTDTQTVNPICESITESILNFNENVGEKKGFVLEQKERQQLNERQERQGKKSHQSEREQYPNWTKEHQWNREQELHKIDKACNEKDCLQIPQTLKDVMIGTSYLFAQEFTNQYYSICISVWNYLQPRQVQSIKPTSNSDADLKLKQSLKQLASNIHTNRGGEYYLLSLNYKICKGEKKRKKQEASNSRLDAYVQFVNDLAEQFTKLMI